MLSIWLITAISFLFGIATGLVNSGAPQAALSLHLSSQTLGLVGAGVPIGYTVSCLLCGRFFSGHSGKRVLLGGVAGGALSLLAMALAKDGTVLVVAQILFGLFSGGMWPFCSAWLLDFESAGVAKSPLLRHYNVSWTGGTATGMYAGGLLCEHGFVFSSFQCGVAVVAVAFVAGTIAREIRRHDLPPTYPADPLTGPHDDSVPRASVKRGRVSGAMLIAAVLFNIAAIGTKMTIMVNYAELNAKLGGGADRMGLLLAVGILSQLAAFGVGAWYEPMLGLRRVYAAGALLLIGVNWLFARSITLPPLPLLLLGEAATGFVLAIAFQGAMLAFTARSATPRHGTTLLEASVGIAGLAPLAAGALTDFLKSRGFDALDAVRAPFYAAIGLIAATLLIQTLLVPAERERRKLLLVAAPVPGTQVS